MADAPPRRPGGMLQVAAWNAPSGLARLWRESASFRRLARLAATACGLCLGARLMAAQLLNLMLYHPMRYTEDPGHAEAVANFRDALGSASYLLEEVDYALPGSWLGGGGAQRAFLVRPRSSATPVGSLWMVFGGNAMVATDWFPFCWELLSGLGRAERGADAPAFLLFDYPGYGANPGKPTPASVLSAQRAALRAAVARLGSAPKELCLLGHSLGGAAASQLAASGTVGGAAASQLAASGGLAGTRPGRLVLSAPFTSIDDMAQAIFGERLLPSWLLRLLLAQRWSNAAWVPRASEAGWQVGIVHGSRDEIVPTSMGRALRRAVESRGGRCAFSEVKGAGHNDLLYLAPGEYHALMGFSGQGAQCASL